MPDAMPLPTRLLRTSWWRVLDYAAVLRWQVEGYIARAQPGDLCRIQHPLRPPVVLVPGVYEAWHFMLPLATMLHSHGVPVHVVPLLGVNRRPVPHQARLLGRYLERHDLRDVVLVAHSKGGLIGKLAMLREDPENRIAWMVAVNTPFAGSVYANWFLVPSVRAFRPNDATIRALGTELAVNHRITSAYSRWDPHIPAGSELEGAEAIVLDTPGHFRPLADPALHAMLLDRLVSPGGAEARG